MPKTKCQDKNLNILRTNRAFKIKQNAFFIVFEALSLKKIFFFSEGESPTLINELDDEIANDEQYIRKMTTSEALDSLDAVK